MAHEKFHIELVIEKEISLFTSPSNGTILHIQTYEPKFIDCNLILQWYLSTLYNLNCLLCFCFYTLQMGALCYMRFDCCQIVAAAIWIMCNIADFCDLVPMPPELRFS